MDKSLIRRIQDLEQDDKKHGTIVKLCHDDDDTDEVRRKAMDQYPDKEIIVVQCWWKPEHGFDTIMERAEGLIQTGDIT